MLRRLLPDMFILTLMATIGLASLLPAQGRALDGVSAVSNFAIFALFFFHGLRLARTAVWEGLKQWRLQLSILTVTFILIPLMGLGASALLPTMFSPSLWMGMLFLCVLPSTIQSAISSSSLAGGNVAASVIAAALSNLSAVILTPLLFATIAHAGGAAVGFASVGKVALLLLLPFILGQIAQAWIAGWAERHKVWIGRMDKLTIILAVYVAFSAAVNEGLWDQLSGSEMLTLCAFITLFLAATMAGSWVLGGRLGLCRADQITLFYSGSHKSLATGAPMARILFPGAEAGLIIIPLMIYHQLQLIISAWIAVRLSRIT